MKTAQELWQDYSFLTAEMLKFIGQQDLSMFNEIMSQREKLQTLLTDLPDKTFVFSSEGQVVIDKIRNLNQQILYKLHLDLNTAKRQRRVNTAYDGGRVLTTHEWGHI